VLAQLEKVDGVAESRVDWTGRYFLLKLAPGKSPEEVAADAGSALKGAKRLDATREAGQIAAYRRGELWMSSGETLKLSEHEAGVLGERFGRKAAEAAGLDADQTKRLLEILREELTSAFARVKGTDAQLQRKFRQECPALIARVAERSRAFVTEEQATKIAESLESTFGREK